MNWVTASAVVFTSSVLLYLLLRKSKLLEISSQDISIGMFIIPVPIYILFAFLTKSSFQVSPIHAVILFVTAFIAGYLANYSSLKGIELAPNPGYSLIIAKSFVIFTSIASVFLFSSPLPVKNIIGIVCIVLFSSLIILTDKKTNRGKENFSWVWFSLGAFFCWGINTLVSKYLALQGVGVITRLLYLTIFSAIFVMSELIFKHHQLRFTKKISLTVIGVGILATIFNIFLQIAIQGSPNPGYVNAISACSIMMVTLISAFLFKDELNMKKMIGVLGVIIGLILLLL